MTLPPPSPQTPGDFIATDNPCAGIQRLRAGFFGHAYDPHRHETYAVGVTERGLQAFRYRGAECVSTTGMTIVLHPDEVHDGQAAAPDGFVYRMIYVDAALIGDALGVRDTQGSGSDDARLSVVDSHCPNVNLVLR